MSSGHGEKKPMGPVGWAFWGVVLAFMYLATPSGLASTAMITLGAIAIAIAVVVFAAKSIVFVRPGQRLVQSQFGRILPGSSGSGPAFVMSPLRSGRIIDEEITRMPFTMKIVTAHHGVGALPGGLHLTIRGAIVYHLDGTIRDHHGNPVAMEIDPASRTGLLQSAVQSVGFLIGTQHDLRGMLLHIPEIYEMIKDRLKLSQMPYEDAQLMRTLGARVGDPVLRLYRDFRGAIDRWRRRNARTHSPVELRNGVLIEDVLIEGIELPKAIEVAAQRQLTATVVGELVARYVREFGYPHEDARRYVAGLFGAASVQDVRMAGLGAGSAAEGVAFGVGETIGESASHPSRGGSHGGGH